MDISPECFPAAGNRGQYDNKVLDKVLCLLQSIVNKYPITKNKSIHHVED